MLHEPLNPENRFGLNLSKLLGIVKFWIEHPENILISK